MTLRPIERGVEDHRIQRGLPPLYHVRLKHQGRTLAVLSGESAQEAHQRAQRLASALFPPHEVLTYEPA